MTSLHAPSWRSGSAGVTLVELMIVLVVIAVGILALSGVQTRSSSDVYATGRRTRALAVAQTQLEVTKGLGYRATTIDTTGQQDGFTWHTDVDPDTTGVNLNRITVTVSWAEKGTPDSLRLIDLVSAR